MKTKLIGAVALAGLLLSGCQRVEPAAKGEAKPYVIGMGEIMGQNQMRHAKLWFAGTDGNWPLAQYEVDELHEGFDDVKGFHPTFKKMATAPMIDEFVAQPLAELDKAVKDKNSAEFTTGFDDLTMGCNGCHKQVGFGFNVIKRPTSPPFTNQEFEPAKGA
jgi:hypothetical protein